MIEGFAYSLTSNEIDGLDLRPDVRMMALTCGPSEIDGFDTWPDVSLIGELAALVPLLAHPRVSAQSQTATCPEAVMRASYQSLTMCIGGEKICS